MLYRVYRVTTEALDVEADSPEEAEELALEDEDEFWDEVGTEINVEVAEAPGGFALGEQQGN